MKIFIVQEKGRHEKNQEFREALNMKRALDRIGIESKVWGLGYDNFSETFDEASSGYDVILILENYDQQGWLPEFENDNRLKIFWSIDSHCVPAAHGTFARKANVQVVLNAIRSHSKYFKKQKCYYFPNAYPKDLIDKREVQKQYDVGFCGSLLNRQEWIEYLIKNHKLKFDNFVIGEDMIKSINSYNIHWNRNLADDINFRTFETLGCGTLLLTNKTENIENLFDMYKHLVTYENMEDMSEKIIYLLNDPQKIKEFSEAGYIHVRENHSYDNRAKQLVEIIKENV